MDTKNTYTTRGTYREKIEAELEMAKAKLEHLRERANLASAVTALLYRRQIDELEMRVAETRARLREMNEAEENGWENFKDCVERAWDSMKESMKEMVDSITDDDDLPPPSDCPADVYGTPVNPGTPVTPGTPVPPRTPYDPNAPRKY
ncbi:MAG: hypothetical protein VB045_05550 [Synergistaceae bacterium]|nr:hypothetical protein [Synergistaceae bacterium]